MKITRYKKLFTVSAVYQRRRNNNSIEETSDGVSLYPASNSTNEMFDAMLRPRFLNNLTEVYYEGIESPALNPNSSTPKLVIDTNKYFYFLLNISGKEKLKALKFHSTPALATENGFPVLYDAKIATAGTQPQVTILDDIKVCSPVFTFTVTQAQCGLASQAAMLNITDEANTPVGLNVAPAALNNKAIDGISAVPEYAFSIDASKLLDGIYTFKVGSYSKKFFITSNIEAQGAISLIRVLKNSFLEYKTSLADSSFAKFELKIPLV